MPLGGHKDGGADAYEGMLCESVSTPGLFYQASIEQDAGAKIRRTVARLREFGRAPKRVVYLTSRTVRYVDRVETDLTEELDVTIAIRDGSNISSHVNHDAHTVAAFNHHLRHLPYSRSQHLRGAAQRRDVGECRNLEACLANGSAPISHPDRGFC